jgi:hypothetical protein
MEENKFDWTVRVGLFLGLTGLYYPFIHDLWSSSSNATFTFQVFLISAATGLGITVFLEYMYKRKLAKK